MTANMDSVFTHGRMEDNMKVIGTMENNMVRAFIDSQMELSVVVSGTKEKEQLGQMNSETNEFLQI